MKPLKDSFLSHFITCVQRGARLVRLTLFLLLSPNLITAQIVPPPVIKSLSMQGNYAVISFSTVQDAVYHVGCTSDIRAGSWSLLGTVVGNGSVVTFADNSTTPDSIAVICQCEPNPAG